MLTTAIRNSTLNQDTQNKNNSAKPNTLQFKENTTLQQETRGVLKKAIETTTLVTIGTGLTALVFGKQLEAWAGTVIDFIYQTMKQADCKKK